MPAEIDREAIRNSGRSGNAARYLLRLWAVAFVVAPLCVSVVAAGFSFVFGVSRTLLGGTHKLPGPVHFGAGAAGLTVVAMVIGLCIWWALNRRNASAGAELVVSLDGQLSLSDYRRSAAVDSAITYSDGDSDGDALAYPVSDGKSNGEPNALRQSLGNLGQLGRSVGAAS